MPTTNMNLPVFFILGRPRSGTTLLRMLFDAHPNAVIPPEFPIIPLLANRFRQVTNWNRQTILKLIDCIYEHQQFGHRSIDQLHINREELTEAFLSREGPGNLGDFLTLFLANTHSLFPKEELLIVGDKNPIYSIYIPLLNRIFPTARFILMIRDYRDTYCSLIQMKGEPIEAHNLALQVSRWRFVTNQFIQYHRQDPDRFFLLRYEELVTKPEIHMQQVCKFLSIPYLPTIFNYYTDPGKVIDTYSSETFQRFHQNLLNPIHTKRIGIWKEILSQEDEQTADQLAGSCAGKLGYSRKYAAFSIRSWGKTLPMQLYGSLLFKLLRAGIYFPYGLRKWMAYRLKNLAKFYSNRYPSPTN